MTDQKSTLVHEETYKRSFHASFIHRRRLKTVLDLMTKIVTPETRSWGDFGCSNGFVIETLMSTMLGAASATNTQNIDRIVGFDVKRDLLELAREKGIKHAEFRHMSLNDVHDVSEQFDVATCLETLEHVGNYENAFLNVFNHVKAGGNILITVPNETGLQGFIKLLGRRVLRRNPYDDFFSHVGRVTYAKSLLTMDRLTKYRTPGMPGYGHHLGWDYRTLLEHIWQAYIETGRLESVSSEKTQFGMNAVCVFRRLPA
jgi:2-polyprenyl-3-methyl-5-hydroxy-6-metoxy-1,4-benzoquinol methylase